MNKGDTVHLKYTTSNESRRNGRVSATDPGGFTVTWDSYRVEDSRKIPGGKIRYNRLNPLHGPPTKAQSVMYGIWSSEIARQCHPVLRFEQFAKKDDA
jgi:hypothetical protein